MVLYVDVPTGRLVEGPLPAGVPTKVLAWHEGFFKEVYVVSGGGDVPAGSALMIDSVGAAFSSNNIELNLTPTDISQVYIMSTSLETNNTPSDLGFGAIASSVQESIPTPQTSESIGFKDGVLLEANNTLSDALTSSVKPAVAEPNPTPADSSSVFASVTQSETSPAHSDSITVQNRANVTENNLLTVDTLSSVVKPTVTESNIVPTITEKAGVSGPGLTETSASPSSSITASITYVASGAFVVPTGVTSATFQCFGGGAAGKISNTTGGGNGGPGGSYCESSLAITPGESLTVTVGAVPAANGNGGDTIVLRSGTTLIRAIGGGSSSTNLGTIERTGGTAGIGVSLGVGGGGGGASGPTASGGNATAATAGTGNPPGGNGGDGGPASTVGSPGIAPGGGGGGGGFVALSTRAGGAGTAGRVNIAWSAG